MKSIYGCNWVVRQFARRTKMPPLILKAMGTVDCGGAGNGGGGGMPSRIPHGYRPMDRFLPPFFLPPLIGHAQKQILTSYSSAHGTCAAQHFWFSQPGGKMMAARRTHALWSVGSQDASVRSSDERRPDLIALFVFGTLPNMPPNGGANVSPSVLPRKRPLQTLD